MSKKISCLKTFFDKLVHIHYNIMDIIFQRREYVRASYKPYSS